MGSGCGVLGCGRPTIAKGMCWAHYQRARRGTPVDVYLLQVGRKSTVVKFGPEKPPRAALRMYRIGWDIFNNFTPEPTTGCHLWLGDMYPSGYGVIGSFRDPWGGYAHRAALYFGGVKLEPGSRLHVRHLCDNPSCVNPLHLSYGTAAENMADRERRYAREGRPARRAGDRHRKYTDEQIASVRSELAAGARVSEIARRFGMPAPTVYAIKGGHMRPRVGALPNPGQHAA